MQDLQGLAILWFRLQLVGLKTLLDWALLTNGLNKSWPRERRRSWMTRILLNLLPRRSDLLIWRVQHGSYSSMNESVPLRCCCEARWRMLNEELWVHENLLRISSGCWLVCFVCDLGATVVMTLGYLLNVVGTLTFDVAKACLLLGS